MLIRFLSITSIIASVVASTAVVSGCATTSTEPMTVIKAPPKAATVNAPVPLRVGVVKAAPPSWLQAPCPKGRCEQHNPADGRIVVSTSEVAVFKSYGGHHFGYVRGKGIVPRIAVPSGMDSLHILAGGRLVARDNEGKLWSASSLSEAVSFTAWNPIPGIPVVAQVSVAGHWLVYILKSSAKVYVGKWLARAGAPTAFRATAPAKNATVWGVAVRIDGTLAAKVEAKEKGRNTWSTHLRAANSKRWVKSAYHSIGGLQSDGQWIWNAARVCPEVLAADGKRWLHFKNNWNGLRARNATRRRWTNLATAGQSLLANVPGRKSSEFSVLALKADKFPDSVRTGRSPCKSANMVSGMSMAGSGRGCKGVRCLGNSLGTSSPKRPLYMGLLGDAECESGHVAGRTPTACGKKAPLLKQPTVVFGDRMSGTFETHVLPLGCRPMRLEAIGGLGVLRCQANEKKGGKAAVYTASKNEPRRWRFEGGALPTRGHGVRMAADGTLLWQSQCPDDRRSAFGFGGGFGIGGALGGGGFGKGGFGKGKGGGFGKGGGIGLGRKGRPAGRIDSKKPAIKPPEPPCEAWVRQPVNAGTPNAWRHIHVDGAIAYRVGLSGHVMAIKATKSAPTFVELIVSKPDGTQMKATLTTGDYVKSLEVDRQGRVVLTDRVDPEEFKTERGRYVMADGSLGQPLATQK